MLAALFYSTINIIYLGFGLLVEQKKLFVTSAFFYYVLIFLKQLTVCLKNELKDCIDNGKSLHPYLSLGRL